jgi:large subunit ribosomal protein L1
MAKDDVERRGEEAATDEAAPKQKRGGKKPRDAEAAPAEGGPPAPPPAADADTKPKGKVKKTAKADEAGERKRSRGRSMRGQSKRHLANLAKIERDKKYSVDEAVKVLKSVVGGTKFTQTVNLVMHLGIDPKQADQMIRGAVSLPKGIGATKKVIAFCEGEDVEKAKAAGAIEAGLDELVKKITDGWTDFDVSIAHPRSMGKVGKLGRVLGPQGKMPSPKNGTVTADIATAVREFAAGKVEFRNDAGGNVHAVVGKGDFSEDDLRENIQAFIGHIRRMKPATSKGTFIKRVCLSGTMSPAVDLDVGQQ